MKPQSAQIEQAREEQTNRRDKTRRAGQGDVEENGHRQGTIMHTGGVAGSFPSGEWGVCVRV